MTGFRKEHQLIIKTQGGISVTHSTNQITSVILVSFAELRTAKAGLAW